MTIFTVHMPTGARDPREMAEKIRLIPEKGSLAAFFFGPLWLARHGAWMAACGFALAMGLLVWLHISLGLAPAGLAAGLALIQLFIGLEGWQMARAAASRGHLELVDVVNAPDVEEGERIALTRLIGAAARREPARPAAPGFRDPDLPGIGLFPGAGG